MIKKFIMISVLIMCVGCAPTIDTINPNDVEYTITRRYLNNDNVYAYQMIENDDDGFIFLKSTKRYDIGDTFNCKIIKKEIE